LNRRLNQLFKEITDKQNERAKSIKCQIEQLGFAGHERFQKAMERADGLEDKILRVSERLDAVLEQGTGNVSDSHSGGHNSISTRHWVL
jgi:hypothetical protein